MRRPAVHLDGNPGDWLTIKCDNPTGIHPQEFYRMKLNIHGHLHKNTESPNLGYPFLNVNWDYWGRALSLDEVRAYVHNNEHLLDKSSYNTARRYIP